ncbi:MAG: hypothetical protein JWM19_1971 [Actinomycetia bacterium]|nr:hypothetical protein [Actinomycetes bacterium]
MKKFLSWTALAIVVIWLFHNPVQGGHSIDKAINDITAFANNL